MILSEPVLELVEVSRSFAHGAVRAVDRVSLQVFPGEIVSLLGPSGCGKTTTMRMIAGLDEPSAGDIRLRGRSITRLPPHQRSIGLVFQSLAAFPHMTVRENVAFGLRMQRAPRAVIAEKVERMLDLVQLPPNEFAGRYPRELSGGQLQRVALARTLVTEPAVVLFDEPMAALDRRLRDYMAIELRNIQKRLGFAAIYVTHDQETASAMSDRLAIMHAGRIAQVGTPSDVYHEPASRFVADFLGDANFLLPESVQRLEQSRSLVRIFDTALTMPDPDPDLGNGAPAIMFRPEHVTLSTAPIEGAAKGTIVSQQFKTGAYRWQIALGDGQQVTAQSSQDVGRGDSVGRQVWLTIRGEHARLLRQ
jgi:ABC-type Fe3+/spermidine/putrescine transport system ATPase subunit